MTGPTGSDHGEGGRALPRFPEDVTSTPPTAAPSAPVPYGTPAPAPHGSHPPHQYAYVPYAAAPPQSNGAATASLVCAILGLFSFGLLSIPGAVLGHIGVRAARDRRGAGQGLAVAGLVISYVVLVPGLLLVLGWVLIAVLGIGILGLGAAAS